MAGFLIFILIQHILAVTLHSKIIVKQYFQSLHTLIRKRGGLGLGILGKFGVWSLDNIAFHDFSVKIGVNAYLAFLFSGSIKKVACRIRPYEKIKGTTDQVVERSLDMLYKAFLRQSPKESVLRDIMDMFDSIEVTRDRRPKVAIFGDI